MATRRLSYLSLSAVLFCLSLGVGNVLHRNESTDTTQEPGRKIRAEQPPRNDFHVLPKRLITVFGLESSGTSWLAETLAQAVEAKREPGFEELTSRNYSTQTEIQHVSLPWGAPLGRNRDIPDVQFIPPLQCCAWPSHQNGRIRTAATTPPDKQCFAETGLQERVQMPQRFVLNITSHVEWYRARGVNATAIVLVRDDYAHFHGKLTYTYSPELALKEDFHAKEMLVQAMRLLRNDELIMVSYEMIMSLQTPFLQDLYKKLGIESNYRPEFLNGNKKYIQAPKDRNSARTGSPQWSVDPGQHAPDI